MKNTIILTVTFLAALFLSSVNAQTQSINEITSNKYALKNLVAGIHSDNLGVKRSSVYFAGKYKIAETEDELISQLKQEEDPSTRILIALVLFEMGSEEGLNEVKDISMNDEDSKVRRITTQIYNDYLLNDSESTVFVTE